jgi:protein gp37
VAVSLASKIEWTDATWNPVRGCSKVSPGCKNCYAERFAERFRGVKGHPFEQGFDIRLVPEKLAEPLRWTEPRMVFVNSMSDLFHEGIPQSFVGKVFRTMLLAQWHNFQILTKRSGRMKRLLLGPFREAAAESHIWWGVSVENRKHGFPRIADLQQIPAPIRFLSIEPLLEDLGTVPLDGISWVIVGGESGPRARPINKEWVESIRQQCEKARVPFFFKQWGGSRKKAAGRLLNGRTYDEFPSRSVHPISPPIVRLQHVLEVEETELVQLRTA